MQRGKISQLGDRESGFIKRDGAKEDLFFHSDALQGITFRELKKGDKVVYTEIKSMKGPYATKVLKDK
jgi:CspA family cold shock protein